MSPFVDREGLDESQCLNKAQGGTGFHDRSQHPVKLLKLTRLTHPRIMGKGRFKTVASFGASARNNVDCTVGVTCSVSIVGNIERYSRHGYLR